MNLKKAISMAVVTLIFIQSHLYAKNVINQQNVTVVLESTEAVTNQANIYWVFARFPGTNIRVVGKAKITQIVGAQDTLTTAQWLGVQDYRKPKRIAQFKKPIKMQWLSHKKTFLKDQKITLQRSQILQDAMTRLHDEETVSFDLSKGAYSDSMHHQLKRWMKGWLTMESATDALESSVFNEEAKKDIHYHLALKDTTAPLEE